MLEKNHDGSYSLNLGNLAANEPCVITLRYAQTLQFEQRGLRLLIPTVIAPRYGDPVQDGGLQPHQAPEHSLMAEYPFDIELRLHGDLAKARIASPSHSIAIRVTDAVATVSLARHGALDRDFVLVIDELVHESAVVVVRNSVESGYVALASFCPRVALHEPAALAIKLLVDCSGSMAGDSIEAAKRALQAIVLQMDKADRFSLSRFGNSVEHRCRALWKAADATRVAAQRWIGDLRADLGGTEMATALKSTFALAAGSSCDVLMVTDGEIEAIDRTIEAAKTSGHRVFVVCIGSSPAQSHMRRLAEATGGACDFVAPGEAVEPAVLRMFARLRSARFEQVCIVWPGEEQPRWSTVTTPSVFDGDTVNAYALFRQIPTGTVQLMGTRPGNDAPEALASAEFGSALESSAALSRMAAHAKVAAYRQRGGFEFAKEALRLSVAYQLVTEQTNYLLVHQRAEGEQAADMPELHKVAQMVPAGWGGVGSVRGGGGDIALPWGPAVWRSVGRREQILTLTRSDEFEIPAFLRRRDIVLVDPSLAPNDLAEKLRATPPAQWPASYDELRDFGVDAVVVDWLVAIAAKDGQTNAEQEWVAAFVFVISQVGNGLGRIFKRIHELFGAAVEKSAPPNVDQRLAEKLVAALAGITANRWPKQACTMTVEFD